MSDLQKWIGMLYAAWLVLLLISAGFHSDRSARAACLVAAGGFAMLIGNLYLAGTLHTLITFVADATLLGALYLYAGARRRGQA